MATDFWSSSHYKRWMIDRTTLKQARAEDAQYVEDPEHLDFLGIYFANVISKLGKKLQLRQRVIATATVFFRRFYIKNLYCETDPFIVIAACCYVAAKAEESPVHIKNVINESRALFSQEQYGIKNFPTDNSKLAEMEFYLVDDLECDLTVFHPYRTLLALCKKESTAGSDHSFESQLAEAGELGVGIASDDAPRYWGTGEGRLELSEGAFQTAWFIINDTYRSELCLIHPPHLIAITAVFMTLILHQPTRNTVLPLISPEPGKSSSSTHSESSVSTTPAPRRSSRNSSAAETRKPPPDPISFFAELNISLPLIATVAQEIISLYTLWDRYKEDTSPENWNSPSKSIRSHSPLQTPKKSGSASRAPSLAGTPLPALTPAAEDSPDGSDANGNIITPSFLSSLLRRMRESRLADLAHPSGGRPVAVNKMLERTQAAG